MNEQYLVDFGTGTGNKIIDGFDDAIKFAEENLAYTQQPVKIYDRDNSEVAKLPWYNTIPLDDDIVVAQFGDFGFYGEWIILQKGK